MMYMPRILLITSKFVCGGAERVLTSLANHWAESGFEVTAMAMGDTGAPPFFPFVGKVRIRVLQLQERSDNWLTGAWRTVWRLLALRRELKQVGADVIISFMDRPNILTLLASRGLKSRVIISERTDPAQRKIGRQWEFLRRLTYPWADSLVCQGERPLQYFGPAVRRRAKIIPNPVMAPTVCLSVKSAAQSDCTLMALGSLRPEKGFDLLLSAFARVAPGHPSWTLVVWGEGDSRPALEAQIQYLRLQDRVFLPGVTSQVPSKMAAADLFVLSSRVEGFPNALTEAMAAGLPVVATDVGAVTEIVRTGVDGLIVPSGDVAALAAALDILMGNSEKRAELGRRAKEVAERFSPQRVVALWEQLF